MIRDVPSALPTLPTARSFLQHGPRPLPPRRQHIALVDLPHAALYAILHRAGPRSRELCRALLDVYGPLPRLAPRGLASLEELLSALAASARHRHLRVLDLSDATDLRFDDRFQALCKALPSLLTLHLPVYSHLMHSSDRMPTLACVAAATAHLRRLSALHAPYMSGVGGAPLCEALLQGWSHLRELTLPEPLLRASSTTALSGCTALSKLGIQGDIKGGSRVDLCHIASVASQLPALVSLQLRGSGYCCMEAGPQLRGLGGLTALALAGVALEERVAAGALQQQVAALTNLRSLHLRLWWEPAWDTPRPGWLTPLALLTALRVHFDILGMDDAKAYNALRGTLEEAAASVPHLPALRELRLGSSSSHGGVGAGLSAAACLRIAAAGSGLELLTLDELALPAAEFTQVLSRLAGLTCLGLISVTSCDDDMPLGWLTALTGLRELGYVGSRQDTWFVASLPCQLLAGLSSVHALTLANCPFLDSDYLAQLCASMPQLRSLDLSGSRNVSAGLSALRRLPNLEVLGAVGTAAAAQLLELIRVPPSLRRCHLGPYRRWQPAQRKAAVALLGRHVEVVFGYWYRDWWDWNE
jgi:hypothetical protein